MAIGHAVALDDRLWGPAGQAGGLPAPLDGVPGPVELEGGPAPAAPGPGVGGVPGAPPALRAAPREPPIRAPCN